MEWSGPLHRLGLALAIGLLVGAERHWRERDEAAGKRTAGVRTFGITGLLGGIAGALAATPALAGGLAGLLLGLCFLGHGIAVLAFKLREAEAEGHFSVTSVVAAQVTFLLGALAMLGDMRLAGAGAVIMTALLASRESLHGFMSRLRWVELRSALLLLTMTLVALPLIPDRPVAALGGLNPARTWTLAVILGAVSFLGYAAVRLFGDHLGRLLAGAATGLVSSTAATLTNARAAHAAPEAAVPLAVGALVAGAVSCLRTAALGWAMAPAMGALLVPSLLAAAAVQGLPALALLRRPGTQPDTRPGAPPPTPAFAGNPFELLAVLQMAGLLALVGLAGQWAAGRFGEAGVFMVAALTALADVDAVTLTMAEMVPVALAAESAAAAVAVAVGANLLAKSGYALALGSRDFILVFVGVSLAALLAGAAGLWLAM